MWCYDLDCGAYPTKLLLTASENIEWDVDRGLIGCDCIFTIVRSYISFWMRVFFVIIIFGLRTYHCNKICNIGMSVVWLLCIGLIILEVFHTSLWGNAPNPLQSEFIVILTHNPWPLDCKELKFVITTRCLTSVTLPYLILIKYYMAF